MSDPHKRQRLHLEEAENWRDWCPEFPHIDFRDGWKVRPIPPLGGALVRFTVRRADTKGQKAVSIYFDGFQRLGYGPEEGYWEVYPAPSEHSGPDGAAVRCGKDEIDTLLDLIEGGLDILSTSNNEH